MSVAGRRGRLVRSLPADVSALLVTRGVNVRYLTGFTGSNGAVLVGHDGVVLATDVRYETQAGRQCPDVEVVIERDVAAALVAVATGRGWGPIGIEADDLTVSRHQRLATQATEAGSELVATTGTVEELRVVKDDEEIASLRVACAISQDALATLLPHLRAGLTEAAVAARLEGLMREGGAEAPAFETIVAAGEHSAIPHHEPTDRALRQGDLLKIDFGARYRGYHADMTRTFVIGPPAQWQTDIHAVVQAAQRAGREALAPGASLPDVDAAARSVVAAADLSDRFGHGLGHGVGLEIHEAPMIGPTATGILAVGTPVTVEPGIYLPGEGGVRIEDTLVVRPGDAESLTTASRELLVLG